MKKNKEQASCQRLGKVGGQAVIEGIMMRGREQHTTAVRLPNGKIIRDTHKNNSISDKYKILKWPMIRGVVNFYESLKLSFSTLSFAADALEIEEETKFEKWLKEKFGKTLMSFVMVIGAVLGVFLAVALFMFLPNLVTNLLGSLFGMDFSEGMSFSEQLFKSVTSGILRIVIFVLYVFLTSFMPDIKRTYQYHGAEHKTIFCYEANEELTVENIKKQKRLHPRCGTSFMFVMLIVGIFISMFISWQINVFLLTLIKILLLPITVGIGYEIIRYAGRHNNAFIRFITAPGIWMQKITTREPSDDQIEVAIVALKSALSDEFSEDDVFDGIEQPADIAAEEEKTEETNDAV